MLKSHCFSSKSPPTLPAPVLSTVRARGPSRGCPLNPPPPILLMHQRSPRPQDTPNTKGSEGHISTLYPHIWQHCSVAFLKIEIKDTESKIYNLNYFGVPSGITHLLAVVQPSPPPSPECSHLPKPKLCPHETLAPHPSLSPRLPPSYSGSL